MIEIASHTAVWYHTGLLPVPIRWVLIRDPQQCFDPQALLCTDLTRDPLTIVSWFVRRWQVEVTFQEVRRTLGVETQRQWAEHAIARTTPCLLALFSLVTLLADRLVRQSTLCPFRRMPGTARRGPRLRMPWPPCVSIIGGKWVFAGPVAKAIWENSHELYGSLWSMLCVVRPDGQSRA